MRCVPTKSVSARAQAVAGLTSVLVAACVGDSVPYGYDRIQQTDQYIPRSRLQAMVGNGQTRSEVVAELGTPDTESIEEHTIVYDRCVTSRGRTVAVVAVPLPIPTSRPVVTSCQRVTVWFDADDRVTSWDEFTYKWEGGDPPQ